MTWLKAGDKNTRFFHKYAEHRQNINTIWEVKSNDGRMVKDQAGITKEAYNHF